MRVIVPGGTRFVGRAVTEVLVAAGHAELVVASREQRADQLPGRGAPHAERSAWSTHRDVFTSFGADAAIDVSAGDGLDAQAALSACRQVSGAAVTSSGSSGWQEIGDMAASCPLSVQSFRDRNLP
jgi:nucleoside-diphosphate-sugar epimerase